jgi:hypothetical protein
MTFRMTAKPRKLGQFAAAVYDDDWQAGRTSHASHAASGVRAGLSIDREETDAASIVPR